MSAVSATFSLNGAPNGDPKTEGLSPLPARSGLASAAGTARLNASIGASPARVGPVDGRAGAHSDQGADEQANMKRAPHDAYQNINVR